MQLLRVRFASAFVREKTGRKLRAAIIGGGLAGLTCAHRLRQRGIEAVVFESASRTGGRALGAPFLLGPDVFRQTFALFEELGLSSELLRIRQTVGQLYRGKVYHHHVASATGLLHFKGLNLFDKALLPKMALFLARHGGAFDFDEPGKGVAYDDESVAEFVKREFSQNILNYVAGPLISSLFFYGSEETSKLLYLLLAKHMHSTGLYTVRGGLEALVKGLTQGSVVRLAAVQEIARSSAGFVVEKESFSYLVVAAPGDSVLRIRGLAGLLSDEDRQFFEACRYQRAMSVSVETEHPVDGHCYSLSIPRVERLSASTITFYDFIDPSRVSSGAGLLSVIGGGDVSKEDLMADLHRIYHVKPNSGQVVEWPSAMPKFPPGRFREIEAFRARSRVPGLVFCGDYLIGPFVEAAITTGIRAAEQVSSS